MFGKKQNYSVKVKSILLIAAQVKIPPRLGNWVSIILSDLKWVVLNNQHSLGKMKNEVVSNTLSTFLLLFKKLST